MSHDTPIAAGTSSFDLVDRGRLFPALGLRGGETVLDLACGRGAYAIAIAALVGPAGRVVAVDLWQEGIAALRQEIAARGLANVAPLHANVAETLPLEPGSVDLCLMATVLHDLVADGTAEGALAQAGRAVRTGGRLAVVEFKKIDGPPGPPRAIRMDAAAVAARVQPHGFSAAGLTDLGPHTYLATFTRT
jgi:ubiquinone/menaquinone biosynthesis C-methylase UbiE